MRRFCDGAFYRAPSAVDGATLPPPSYTACLPFHFHNVTDMSQAGKEALEVFDRIRVGFDVLPKTNGDEQK